MPGATIRSASLADIPAIATIYEHAVRHGTATFELDPPDVAEMTRRFDAISASGCPYLVALRDGVIVGYVYASTYRPRPAYRFTVEDSIYLAPEAQGRGVGTQLINELIAQSVARGYRQMIAVIGDSANAASIALHKRAGFEMIGTHPDVGFKFGRWLDSVLMQRDLGEGAGTLPEA